MAYVQIFLQMLALILFHPKYASGYEKESINGDNLIENLVANVWNLNDHTKTMFNAHICAIANRKETNVQLTTELEQLKVDLADYCGAHKNTQEKGEKLEKIRENVKKLLGSGDWAKNMKKSLNTARKEFEANKNDGKVKMALKQEKEILSTIKQKMPSAEKNIPEWFRSGLANALLLEQNGQISVKGLFGLLDTIFDKFFVGKNGFANQILSGTQGQGHDHHQHNRASAHVPFGSVRVKRADDFPGFIPALLLVGPLLLIVVVFGPILFPLLVVCLVIGGILMAIMGD